MTLNASLRVQYEAPRVDWGAQNRVTRVRYRAGGRGLAVARVLRTLGHDVVAAGLAGGATGGLIATDLARYPGPADLEACWELGATIAAELAR